MSRRSPSSRGPARSRQVTPGLDFYDTGVALVTDKKVEGVESISVAEGEKLCWGVGPQLKDKAAGSAPYRKAGSASRAEPAHHGGGDSRLLAKPE